MDTQVDQFENPTRVCNKCGLEKPVKNFSLKVGVRSSIRKSFCTTCEKQIRDAKKYGIELEELWAMLRRPCYICGQAGEMIDADKRGRPKATLCRRCSKLIKMISADDREVVLGAKNYVVLSQYFPFWLRWTAANAIQEEQKPLIDWIENADRVG